MDENQLRLTEKLKSNSEFQVGLRTAAATTTNKEA